MEGKGGVSSIVALAAPLLQKQSEIEKHNQLMQIYERQKKAKTLISVPSNEKEAKANLRFLRQPITLFGEDIEARKERLKAVITKIYLETGSLPKFPIPERETVSVPSVVTNQVFYTEGCPELKEARIKIALYSIPQCTMRLESTKKNRIQTDRVKELEDYDKYLSTFQSYKLKRTLYSDDRRISYGILSPNEDYIATSGWSGDCNIWKVPNGEHTTVLKGHTDKVTYIAFHPYCGSSISQYGPNIATSSVDMSIRLWTFNPEEQSQNFVEFKGHEDRTNCVDFHPSGLYMGSTCHDCRWKLWDLEKKLCICTQEGHVAPVRPINFQRDGALIATGDEHGIGLIWDLRTGKEILTLQGHVGQIIALRFLPNSYQIASSSDDHSIKIWDLRKRCCVYTIPAHNGAVTDIKFVGSGKVMLSCSFDNVCKIWSTSEWQPVCELKSNDSHLSSVNMTSDGQHIMTTTYDKKLCFWERCNDKKESI